MDFARPPYVYVHKKPSEVNKSLNYNWVESFSVKIIGGTLKRLDYRHMRAINCTSCLRKAPIVFKACDYFLECITCRNVNILIQELFSNNLACFSNNVEIPRPKRLERVRYSQLVASFQIVTATRCSTLTASRKWVVCLSMYGRSSSQRIVNVCWVILRFSFHHASPYLPLCKSIHHCLLLHTCLSRCGLLVTASRRNRLHKINAHSQSHTHTHTHTHNKYYKIYT